MKDGHYADIVLFLLRAVNDKNGATALAAPFIDTMEKSGYLSGFFLLFSMANASGVSSSPFRFSAQERSFVFHPFPLVKTIFHPSRTHTADGHPDNG